MKWRVLPKWKFMEDIYEFDCSFVEESNDCVKHRLLGSSPFQLLCWTCQWWNFYHLGICSLQIHQSSSNQLLENFYQARMGRFGIIYIYMSWWFIDKLPSNNVILHLKFKKIIVRIWGRWQRTPKSQGIVFWSGNKNQNKHNYIS